MARHDSAMIGEVRDLLALSQKDLASLLGVSCRALTEWRSRGIPPEHRAKIERLHNVALALKREILPTHIPEIVRTCDALLGDRSILDVIRAEGVAPIDDYLRRLFAYSS